PNAMPNIASKATPSPASSPTPSTANSAITPPPPATPATQSLSGGSGSSKGGIFKILGALALLIVLGLGGYAGYQLIANRQGATSSGPVTLRYWGLWEPAEVIQPLIAEYEAANPNVKIEY